MMATSSERLSRERLEPRELAGATDLDWLDPSATGIVGDCPSTAGPAELGAGEPASDAWWDELTASALAADGSEPGPAVWTTVDTPTPPTTSARPATEMPTALATSERTALFVTAAVAASPPIPTPIPNRASKDLNIRVQSASVGRQVVRPATTSCWSSGLKSLMIGLSVAFADCASPKPAQPPGGRRAIGSRPCWSERRSPPRYLERSSHPVRRARTPRVWPDPTARAAIKEA